MTEQTGKTETGKAVGQLPKTMVKNRSYWESLLRTLKQPVSAWTWTGHRGEQERMVGPRFVHLMKHLEETEIEHTCCSPPSSFPSSSGAKRCGFAQAYDPYCVNVQRKHAAAQQVQQYSPSAIHFCTGQILRPPRSEASVHDFCNRKKPPRPILRLASILEHLPTHVGTVPPEHSSHHADSAPYVTAPEKVDRSRWGFVPRTKWRARDLDQR
jgi:hypothetical protein